MSDNVLSNTPCNCSTVSGSCGDYNEVKIKTVLRKIVRDFGLACVFPFIRNRNSGDEESVYNHDTCDMEQNKAWLLAESGGSGGGGGGGDELMNADPQSVHSSFRFSICSQIELESMSVSSSTNSTVLMVNLSNGSNESKTLEMKWRRVQSIEKSISPVTNALTRFGYPEIFAATRGFSKDRVLGRGALSYVFRGKLGFLRTTVAIKRLEKDDKESPKSFCRELMIASSLNNTYIVPLLGFCIDHEEGLFLVYKYVSGGSLDRHLHEKKKKKKKGAKGFSFLSCSVRYKVALGIAEAISYLHNGTERCVVHRDIKPCNILLSSKKTPMLCDFGLATWTSAPSVPFLCKTVKGTFGYLAPEYFQHGKVSDKTDVYAFGVVLLELITGRKPIEAKRPPGEENLVQWVKPLLHKKIEAVEELLDPYLKYTSKSSTTRIDRMIQAASACLTNEESHRPSIQEILALLKGADVSIYLNRRKKIFSGRYSLSQETENEMNSRLTLATLGVSEFEDDDHLFWR